MQAWAKSYVKFLDLWAAQNVTFWGFTIQNEPGSVSLPGVSWNAMTVSGAGERELVAAIGPLVKAKYPHIKMMVHDDQVYALKSRLEVSGNGILDSPFVDGIAYHWYGTNGAVEENTTAYHIASVTIPIGGGVEVREVYETHIRPRAKAEGKFMLATEACNGFLVNILHALLDGSSESNNRGVRPGDWYRGYRYSKDIYYQLSNGASGWVDWNLLLDSSGGPNWAGNNVDAPVLVSTDNSSLWVNPMYFHLAHWAKYVTPGSVALAVAPVEGGAGMRVAAFRRPDTRVVLVVLSDQLDGHGDPPANQQLTINIDLGAGKQVQQKVHIASGSITTVVVDC